MVLLGGKLLSRDLEPWLWASSRETELGLVPDIRAPWKSGAFVFLNHVPL